MILISAYEGEGYILWEKTSELVKNSHTDLNACLSSLVEKENASPTIRKSTSHIEKHYSPKGPHWNYSNPRARYKETLFVSQKNEEVTS